MTDINIAKEKNPTPAETRKMHETSIKQSLRELTVLFGEDSVRGYLQCASTPST